MSFQNSQLKTETGVRVDSDFLLFDSGMQVMLYHVTSASSFSYRVPNSEMLILGLAVGLAGFIFSATFHSPDWLVLVLGGIIVFFLGCVGAQAEGVLIVSSSGERRFVGGLDTREREKLCSQINQACRSLHSREKIEAPQLLVKTVQKNEPFQLGKELVELKRLFDSGAITESEFEAAKGTLLSKVS